MISESWKWRSGREADRTGVLRAESRGGKGPRSLGGEEGEAAERDGDVVVPAAEAAAFEVIEAELAFEVLVDPLGAPPFFQEVHELDEGHALVRGEVEVERRVVVVAPLADEPDAIAAARLVAVVGSRDDADEGKARAQRSRGPLAPRVAAEHGVVDQACGEIACGECVAVASTVRVDAPHARGVADRDRIVEVELAAALTELGRIAVALVGEHGPAWQVGLDRASQHRERELRFGLEDDVVGDTSLGTARRVVGPAGGQIQLEVDRDVILRRRDREADADLAVGDLAGRACVLPLHADRVLALLEEAGVVDDPRPRDRCARHRRERVARRRQPDRVVVPRRVCDEMQEALMRGVHVRDAGARAGHDRLHALAITVADQPHRVAREVLAPLRRAEHLADAVEEPVESLLRRAVDRDVHDADQITPRSAPQPRTRRATQPIGMIQLRRSPRRTRGADAVVLRTTVGTTLAMTNILSNDVHYRRIAELWLAWARLGVQRDPSPREHFDALQELCEAYGNVALLVVVRALDQMGFEPSDPEQPLSSGAMTLRTNDSELGLSWNSVDGTITLRCEGAAPVRLVPLASSLASMEPEQLRLFVAEADAHAAPTGTTVVLYPTPPPDASYDRLGDQLASRLQALAHEGAATKPPRVGFLPISPWDLSSVERVARLIRWTTSAPRYLAYPPILRRPPAPEFLRDGSWLEMKGDRVAVVRAPKQHEELATDELVANAATHLRDLQAERERVALALREAHRDSLRTRDLNAAKKDLHRDITAAEADLDALKAFSVDLQRAVAATRGLLRCPTCRLQADPQREFDAGPGRRFSCTCSGCSTSWGTLACAHCGNWTPTLLPSAAGWKGLPQPPGWVDRNLGADVLAVPCPVATEVSFVCPSCGRCGCDAGTHTFGIATRTDAL